MVFSVNCWIASTVPAFGWHCLLACIPAFPGRRNYCIGSRSRAPFACWNRLLVQRIINLRQYRIIPKTNNRLPNRLTMCNCGNQRSQLGGQHFSSQDKREPLATQVQKMWPDIKFMYTGQSALSVTGTITGKSYRFNSPGTQQPVDFRDAPSMMMVPVLKRV